MGMAALPGSRSAVVGFEGTLGSFGMSGGTVVLPGGFTFEIPFGRSLDKDGNIQLDSGWSGIGGVLPTIPIPRNKTNLIALHSGVGDVELDFGVSVLGDLLCEAELASHCGGAQRVSIGNCFVCCGHFHLSAAGCSEKAIGAFCK